MSPNYKNSAKLVSLLILLALGIAAVFAPHSTGESGRWANGPENEQATRNAFGRLPLSFELNQGQADARVKFLARGHGYALFLTDNGAVFSFSETKTALHMRLQDAATSAQITGVDQLPGKVNYLRGNNSTDWCTDIPTYARVRYEQVYKGVDLVYYGNQRQLEYDFVVQPGASFKQIRLAFEGAGKPRPNRRGELILKSGEHKLKLLKPKAYQEIDNTRHEVSVRYSLNARGEVTFKVGNYDKSQPLVIDPLLVYSTFLGGSGLDVGKSIAADSSGNTYIAGQTSSLNFPTSAPLQTSTGGGTDAFVAKLNANGSALIYSTFIGGANNDSAASIAIGTAGNAYLTGQTSSANFPVLNALHPTLNGTTDAFVAELNSAGSALIYSTYLGGRGADVGNSIAIDAQGNAYVAGNTPSTDFPTTNPLQANRLGHAIYKSTNAAGNWAGSDSGLAASVVFDFAFAPNNSSIMYAAAETGLFKTTDGGANWNSVPTTPTLAINKLAIDPTNSAIIYAAATGGMFKSTDGGNNFTAINNGFIGNGRAILVDPVTPTTLYGTSFGSRVFKSIDAGASWTSVFINNVSIINALAINPNTPATLFAATNFGLFKSINGGVNWTAVDLGLNFSATVNNVAIDKTNGAVYAATIAGLLQSLNGGSTWTNLSGTLNVSISNVAIDPTNSSILYVTQFNGPSKSIDGGVTWTVSNTGFSNSQVLSFVINPSQPSTLFIGTASGSDAFVTKLSAGGASQVYSTYLGGNTSDSGLALALDGSGNAYLTGSTTSSDFPTASALQPIYAGNGDAFIAKLNPSGSALVYSTFLGGEIVDSARAIAVDTSGNAYVGGSTNSFSFPLANAFQTVNSSFSGDGFVAKVNAAGSALVYSTYLGGQGVDDCVGIAVDAAGSAYVTGNTNSPDFPTVVPLQAQQNGFRSDAFVTKFAPDGSSLIYSTYLGGTQDDGGNAIAVDSSQRVYLVGSTNSPDFPTLNPLQPTRGGSSDLFVAKLRPAPDIQITLTDDPDPVDFGNNLTYTIEVKNVGELPATGVALSDNLPAGSTFVSLNSTVGTCSGTTSITCNLGTMNAGVTAQISIQIKPPAASPLNNTASVTLNEADAIPANNTATAQTTVRFTDLSITKSVAQGLVAPGGKLTYSLSVKNNGPLSTTATVTDNLPAGTSLIKCVTTTSSVCGQNGNTITAVFVSLEPGASETMLMIVGVSASATEGTVITNTASVVSTTPEPNTANNSASASVTVATVAVPQKSNGLIAFLSQRNSGTEPSGIYTIKPDGTDEKLFPNIPNGGSRPTWSPDGTKLAFQSLNFASSSVDNEFSIINADGTGLLKVASNGWDQNRMITWSPNGTQIAYIGLGGPDISTIRTVHIANADGSGSYRLPGSPSFLDSVDWSPDGSKFVYALNGEIYVMNADATGQTKLTTIQQTSDGPTNDIDPRWSPDGTKIMLLRSTCCSSAAIHVMNADGSNLRKLFTFNAPTAAWSPDGVSIVAQAGAEICRVNLDNTNFKCLTNDSFNDRQPSWQQLPNPNPTPTPTPQPTFSITGKITNSSDGSPVVVSVKLTGPVNTFPSVDSNGNYEFVNIPAGQYTLTPLSNFHTFEPLSRSITITNANITDQNFVATFAPSATVTGHVKDSNGNPLGGIQITLGFLGSIPQVQTTDANGLYSFANVPRNFTCFINPDPLTPYDFVPSSKILNDLATTEIVDFVGTLQPTKVISGRVIEAINGQGIGGVQVNLFQDSFTAGFTVTDANGNFSFGGRKMNHRYGVSVPALSLYIVEPQVPGFELAFFDIPNLTSNQNLTFAAAKRNTVQFSAATAAVNESSGFKEIVVTRSGDLTSAANVDFATADTAGLTACSVAGGKASERCDYGSTAGTLRFAAGEASKSSFVPIVNDANVEGNEAFTIALSSPIGAQLGSTANVTVTITDNDTTPATQNPIDAIDPFVTQQYIDFLGRLPDSVGFANWLTTLNGCPNGGFGENDNPGCDRVHVSAGFFQSDEFRGRGYWAYRFYEVGFDRRPSYAEFVPDMAQVGGAQSPQSELLSKAAYTDAFVQRSEFTSRYNALTNAAYVNALEQNAEIVLTNKADLIAALDGNQKSRGQVLREIVESKAVEDQFFIRAFVAMQYFGYLRRDPDTVGYNNWVTTLTNDPSNFRHMIFGFLFSGEYRGRFGP
jgi:uncharacterized repeat protein (TIGR01451 family)